MVMDGERRFLLLKLPLWGEVGEAGQLLKTSDGEAPLPLMAMHVDAVPTVVVDQMLRAEHLAHHKEHGIDQRNDVFLAEHWVEKKAFRDVLVFALDQSPTFETKLQGRLICRPE